MKSIRSPLELARWLTAADMVALLFSPLTLTAGPIVSYNVAAILMPALAAWTAFVLCRRLTHAIWPSLVGGYLFGFSSYVLAQGGGGHLQLSSVFLLPLVALVDRLLERGVVLTGGATISVAGVDLIELRLNLILAAADAFEPAEKIA